MDGKKKSCSLTEFGKRRLAGIRLRLRSHRFDASVAVVSPSDSLIPTSCTIATLAWHYTTHRPCHKYLQQVWAVLLKEPGLSPLGLSVAFVVHSWCALPALTQFAKPPIACAHDHQASLRRPIQATLRSSTRINSASMDSGVLVG